MSVGEMFFSFWVNEGKKERPSSERSQVKLSMSAQDVLFGINEKLRHFAEFFV